MFYNNFVMLCHKKGLAPTTVCRSMGISSTNLANWRRGVVPHYSTIIKISEFLGVPTEALTGSACDCSSDDIDSLIFSLKTDPLRRKLLHILVDASADEVRDIVDLVDVLMRVIRR